MKQPFSKKLLILDYIIAVALIVGYFVCVIVNSVYANIYIENMILNEVDISTIVVPVICNLDGFGVLLGSWIVQLGVSSGAYYYMSRSDHKIELPIKMINTLPDDIKEQVDMNELITTVLQNTEN